MKELFTEQQLDWIVMGISVLATLISLGWGIYETRKLSPSDKASGGRPGSAKKSLWANAILFAFTGPAIWIFWIIYNSIENYYGLDSVKALEINFGIVIGIAVFFLAVQWLIVRLMPVAAPKRRR